MPTALWIRNPDLALAGVAQQAGASARNQTLWGPVPVRAQTEVAGSVPVSVCAGGNQSVLLPHIDVSLPPSSL